MNETQTRPDAALHVGKHIEGAITNITNFLDVLLTQKLDLEVLLSTPQALEAFNRVRGELKVAIYKELSSVIDRGEIALFFMDKLVPALSKYSHPAARLILVEDVLPTYKTLLNRRKSITSPSPSPVTATTST